MEQVETMVCEQRRTVVHILITLVCQLALSNIRREIAESVFEQYDFTSFPVLW